MKAEGLLWLLQALRQQGEFDRAKVELMKAHSLYPKSKEITEELQKVEK